jgi:hypothetical protein
MLEIMTEYSLQVATVICKQSKPLVITDIDKRRKQIV